MISVKYDDAAHLVRYACDGFYTPGEVGDHTKLAEFEMARCRKQLGHVRVLVLCGVNVQSSDTMTAASQQRRPRPEGSRDRTAFVVGSALLKMQMARIHDSPSERCFTSEDEAITWLSEA